MSVLLSVLFELKFKTFKVYGALEAVFDSGPILKSFF